MVMSYTAIPYNERGQNVAKSNEGSVASELTTNHNHTNNNHVTNSVSKPNRHSSSLAIKSPNSMPRRSSNAINHNNIFMHASTIGYNATNNHTSPPGYEQEIYEGFTFLQSQKQRKPTLLNCPFHAFINQLCWYKPKSGCLCKVNPPSFCVNQPLSFSNNGLERIYQKYFITLYQSTLLTEFYICLTILCVAMSILGFGNLPSSTHDSANTSTDLQYLYKRLPMIKYGLLISIGIFSIIPIIYMNIQCCMRPKHLFGIRIYGFLLCFLYLIAISPLMMLKETDPSLILSVGIWEIMLLILIIGLFYQMSLYTFLGTSSLLFIVHSIIGVAMCLVSPLSKIEESVASTTIGSITKASITGSSNRFGSMFVSKSMDRFSWFMLAGNWLLFIATCLICSIVNYLHQKLLRKSFLSIREFLNNCVDSKIASEKLDRLLACIAPSPILPELRQAALSPESQKNHPPLSITDILNTSDKSSKSMSNTGPPVVHLRNISFISVIVLGLGQLVMNKSKNNSNNKPTNPDSSSDADESSSTMMTHNRRSDLSADAVKLMNELFSRFDMLGQELGCYRIRADPDDYLAISGYPETRVDHARSCVELGARINQMIRQLGEQAGLGLQVKVGVHTGATYGTVVGAGGGQRPAFDLLGDDVRAVKQIVLAADHGKVLVSKSTFDQLPDEYKGEAGPSIDVPVMTTSASTPTVNEENKGTVGSCGVLDTWIMKPRHTKQNSLLVGELNGLSIDNDKSTSNLVQYTLTDLPITQAPNRQSPDSPGNQLTNEYRAPVLTQSQGVKKLTQHAKFNVNTPYYFLFDDNSYFDDNRLYSTDIGNNPTVVGVGLGATKGVVNSVGMMMSGSSQQQPVPYSAGTTSHTFSGTNSLNPGSPLYGGTNKSSATWKSTLRSQMTQSLIGTIQIEEGDIEDDPTKYQQLDFVISKLTGTFIKPVVENEFQQWSETYIGFALVACLFFVMLLAGVHGLLLPKTSVLLLLFLVVFIWICFLLLILLLAKLKCISDFAIRSRRSCAIIMVITVLGMFAVFAANSMCCNTTQSPRLSSITKNKSVYTTTKLSFTSKPMYSTTRGVLNNREHLNCPAPIYSIISTLWVLLPMLVMFFIPNIVKMVLFVACGGVNCIIIFYTHAELFRQYGLSLSETGFAIQYMSAIFLQLFIGFVIMAECRILNTFRRLEYKWGIRNKLKLEENQKFNHAVEEVINNLLPQSVSRQLLRSTKHYMNLYSHPHNNIHILSICIPNWSPNNKNQTIATEPSDVAGYIRQLNKVLQQFDQVIDLPECGVPSRNGNQSNEGNDVHGNKCKVIKIRSAGETAWFGIDVEDVENNNSVNNTVLSQDTLLHVRQRQALAILHAAEMMKKVVEDHNAKNPEYHFSYRIGIHSGTAYSGVIGSTKPIFSVWGEANVGATLIQRYSQFDKIHISGQFFSELEPAYRDNFYDVGVLHANHLGQIIPATPNNKCRWNLRVLCLKDGSSNSQQNQHALSTAINPHITYQQQTQQQQIPMTKSNNNHLDYTQPLSIVTSHNNNPNNQQQVLMMNSNLISLCSDDSVFPVTGLSTQLSPQQMQHHSPQQRNSMTFNPPIISTCTGNGMVHQPISNHESYHPLQAAQQQPPMMMNQQPYMVQSNILASPSAIISSISSSVSPPNIASSILPPHNHMIPIQPATSPPMMNQQQQQQVMPPSAQLSGNMNPSNNDILMMMMRNNANNNNNANNMVRSQGEFPNNNCNNGPNNNRRNRIHRYKNLATELPNSIIPPSPPPHKRTYNENSCESPPVIPPRNNPNSNNYSEKALMTQSDMLIPLSSGEGQKLTHSAKTKLTSVGQRVPVSQQHQQQHLSVQQRSALTPSSSMDSFLEMEKACSGSMQHGGRAKSALYSDVPPHTIGSTVAMGATTEANLPFTQRLSLIPEGANYVFQKNQYHLNNNPNIPSVTNNRPTNNIDIMTTSDDRLLLGGVDVMTTSDDRVFDQQNHLNNNHTNMMSNTNSNLLLAVDNSDITSHHNPIYTDNEYESMVESQVNLLDQDGSKINVVMRTRGMVHEMSLDFPDYKRPDSPPCPGNGDDSDHLSKRNRNSSNSRDSSSCMATNNGANSHSNQGNRSSSHSNQSMTDNKSSNRNSSVNHSSDENNGKNNVIVNDENNNKDNRSNKKQKEKHSPTSIEMTEDKNNFFHQKPELNHPFPANHSNKHHINQPMSNIGAVAPDNASSCISLVTDLGGWTSYDEQDYYDGSEHQNNNSSSHGILSNNESYDYHGNQGNSKVARLKSKKSHKNHFGDDDDYDEGNNIHDDDDDDDDDMEEDESDIDAMRLHSDLISDYSENPLVSDLEDLTDTDISYQHSLMSFADDKSHSKGGVLPPRGFNKKSGYLGDYNTSTGGSTGSSINFSNNKNGSGKVAGAGFYKFPMNNRLNPRFYHESNNSRMAFGEERQTNRNNSGPPSQIFASHPWSGPNTSNSHGNTDSSDHIYSLPATDTIDQKQELAKPHKHKKLPEIAPVQIPDFTKSKHPVQSQQLHNSSSISTKHQTNNSAISNNNNAPISRIPIRKMTSTNNTNSNKNSENSSLNKLSDQSEYDNIANKNNDRMGKHLVRNVRSLDGDGESKNRNKVLMNGMSEDSDAMSGYIGDVASSVYDSDYEDEDNNQFLENEEDQEEIDEDDPMGRFFPRLQTKNQQQAASSLSCNNPVSSDHNSSSKQASRASSTGAIRSDYDNVNSDELPRKQIPIKNARKSKLNNHPEVENSKQNELVQQQIAEEARKISQIYKRQWTHQSGGNQTDDGNTTNYEDKPTVCNSSNQSVLNNSHNQDPSSSDDFGLEHRSDRETSADMLDEGDEDSSWDSPDRNDANNIGRSDQELHCRSTDCVLSNNKKQPSSSPEQRQLNQLNTHKSNELTEIQEAQQCHDKPNQPQKSVSTNAAKGLQKLQDRASKVRSLLPPELHPYVLPGCISNSSVNSCSDTNGNTEGIKKQGGRKQRNGIPVYKASARKRQHFSDEERSKRSV